MANVISSIRSSSRSSIHSSLPWVTLVVWLGAGLTGEHVAAQSLPPALDITPTGSLRPWVPAQVLPGTSALMDLPAGAGMADTVREQLYANGAVQVIRMDGPAPHGENVLEVAVQTDATPVRRDVAVPLARPSEQGIRAEISARFPDVRMQIVPQPLENGFGPFGLAIGRYADGTRCVFAWQWIDDVSHAAQGETGLSRLASAWSHKTGSPASVRVRLCRPDVSVDELAGTIQGLTLGASANFERVRAAHNIVEPGQSVGQPARRGGPPEVIAAPTYVADGSLESVLGPEPSPQVRPQRCVPSAPARPRVARRESVPQPRQVAVARAARAKPVAQAPRAPQTDTLTPSTGGYMVPVAQAAPGLSAPAYRSSAMDIGLPPQAFRGPTSSTNTLLSGAPNLR